MAEGTVWTSEFPGCLEDTEAWGPVSEGTGE